VICLAFTGFDLSPVYFFRSTMLVMLLSYDWYRCWFLPVLLSYLDDFDIFKIGQSGPVEPYHREKVLEDINEPLADPTPTGSDGGEEISKLQRELSERLTIWNTHDACCFSLWLVCARLYGEKFVRIFA
jgi:hypothetical protein